MRASLRPSMRKVASTGARSRARIGRRSGAPDGTACRRAPEPPPGRWPPPSFAPPRPPEQKVEVGKALRQLETAGAIADFVFLDPPYAMQDEYAKSPSGVPPERAI